MSLKFKYFSANLIVIYIVLAFYLTNKYYIDFLRVETRCVLCAYAIIYSVGGFIYYCFADGKMVSETKGHMLLRTIRNYSQHFLLYFRLFPNYKIPPIGFAEKTNSLFILVKIYFLPMMVNFLFNNFSSVVKAYSSWFIDYNYYFTVEAFNAAIYPLLFGMLLLGDCLIFTLGYSIDAEIFQNKIRSVEPTMLGWIAALLCYPPFNYFPNLYVSNYANDYAVFASENTTFWARMVALVLFTVYVWCSVALGMKSSNLTNRGIVSNGPYAYVRHPAYVAKNLAWWTSVIAVNTLQAYFGMLLFSFIYFLRAITEERHLIKDPDYQQYCKKVKYRFIPGVL